MSRVVVLYKSQDGVMTFLRNKLVFQHRSSKPKAKVGLGVLVDGTYVEAGKCGFSDMKNVIGVVPEGYSTIDSFQNIGFPKAIFRGTYGDTSLVKEVYPDHKVIRTWGEDGSCLYREHSRSKAGEKNFYFHRLDNVVTDWEDVTSAILTEVLASLGEKNCDLNIANLYVLHALKGIYKNKVFISPNGVIWGRGRHETLVIWGTEGNIAMSWLGRHIEPPSNCNDITEEISVFCIESGIMD